MATFNNTSNTSRAPDKEHIRLLVDTLRSDRFQQGREHLKLIARRTLDGEKRTQHCCLGVACEIAIEHGLSLTVDQSYNGRISFDGETGYLPNKVQDWYGLPANPYLEAPMPKFRWYRLFWQKKQAPPIVATEANDDLGLSFLEIADAFERTYLK